MTRRLSTYLESCQQIEQLEISLLVRSQNEVRSDLGDLTEMCASIRQHGLLQPLLVRPRGPRFEVICGNRRLEACHRLMKRSVDCIVRDLSDQAAFEVSIIENIQRRTLSALEEARAFRKYASEFGWGGISDLAARIGKSDEYVSHRILLLNLPGKILAELEKNAITASQAQELLWFRDESARDLVFDQLKEQDLSIKWIRRIREEIEGKTTETRPAIECFTEGPRVRSTVDKRYDLASSSNLAEAVDPAAGDRKVIEEAILALRVALIRLDSSLSKCQSREVRNLLMAERFSLHGQIDRLIQAKTKFSH